MATGPIVGGDAIILIQPMINNGATTVAAGTPVPYTLAQLKALLAALP